MRNCKSDNCKDKNSNCSILGSDSLPVQCVGSWAEDKYFYLEKYLNASREARRKFSDRGNAVFIDLFAGPGKCVIRYEDKEIDGGGIKALNRDEAPFNEYYYFDINETNVKALEKRTSKSSNCHIKCGDSNVLINDLVKKLLGYRFNRYHFAYIDPFGPDALKFNTIRELAKLQRMDMLIHFPIGAIKRNIPNWIDKPNNILNEFLGTNKWRDKSNIKMIYDKTYRILVDIYKEQLLSVGYPEGGLKFSEEDILPVVSVKNTKDRDLYALILVSKDIKLAQKIWNSIIKSNLDGQGSLF